MANFVCPDGHVWSAGTDEYDLVDGYGNPPCPECQQNSFDADDFGDFKCPTGHTVRKYGNGGLTFGMVPMCEEQSPGGLRLENLRDGVRAGPLQSTTSAVLTTSRARIGVPHAVLKVVQRDTGVERESRVRVTEGARRHVTIYASTHGEALDRAERLRRGPRLSRRRCEDEWIDGAAGAAGHKLGTGCCGFPQVCAEGIDHLCREDKLRPFPALARDGESP